MERGDFNFCHRGVLQRQAKFEADVPAFSISTNFLRPAFDCLPPFLLPLGGNRVDILSIVLMQS